MSFKAELEIAGKKHDLLGCSYSFYRDVDQKGRPASIVYGGRVDFTIESTDDTAIVESMLNNMHKPVSGSVTWTKVDEDGTLKKLEFENAFVISYAEAFATGGADSMQIKFSVSAQKIKVGSAELENDWPGKK